MKCKDVKVSREEKKALLSREIRHRNLIPVLFGIAGTVRGGLYAAAQFMKGLQWFGFIVVGFEQMG